MTAQSAPVGFRAWVPWVLIGGLVCTVVALLVGILTRCSGTPLATAILSGCGAFGSAAALCLAAPAAFKALKELCS